MRNQEKMLSKMIAIASANFNGKLDKGGKPYILHCFRVMDGVKHLGPEVMQIAMAHGLGTWVFIRVWCSVYIFIRFGGYF
jgi:hypothetical protein